MRKMIRALPVLMFCAVLVSSCLSDDDTDYGNECYISSFTLGNVKRHITTTTSSGEDSTYSISYSPDDYPMTIDQLAGEIYNKDSLPVNTYVTAVLAELEGSGVAYYSEDEEEWTAFDSDDSIDFSSPLTFRVISLDGTAARDYTVWVNIHQTDGDVFGWDSICQTTLWSDAEELKVTAWNEKLYLFAGYEEGTHLFTASLSDGSDWEEQTLSGCDEAQVRTLTLFGDSFFMSLSDSTLITSDDAISWTAIETEKKVSLFAADDNHLYAFSGGAVCRSDDGMTWIEESLDDEASLLPVRDITAVAYDQGNGQSRVLLAGNRSLDDYPSDTAAVLWSRNSSEAQDADGWVYYIVQDDNSYALPRLEALQILRYNDVLVALGLASLNGNHTALDALLMSEDNGLTWKGDDEEYEIAEELNGAEGPLAACVDNDDFIWIVVGEAVWRGRLNRLGFEIQD